MVPVVGGGEISTDNTCEASVALDCFFEGRALKELNAYKDALVHDIALLEAIPFLKTDCPQRMEKEERLAQINTYIIAVSAMKDCYVAAIDTCLEKPSNLYSIQLRPKEQDSFSHPISPAFNIERKNDDSGTPLSALYNEMHAEAQMQTRIDAIEASGLRYQQHGEEHCSAHFDFTPSPPPISQNNLQSKPVNTMPACLYTFFQQITARAAANRLDLHQQACLKLNGENITPWRLEDLWRGAPPRSELEQLLQWEQTSELQEIVEQPPHPPYRSVP
ncbi:hypothetical protein Lbir_0971 [Legionella birminghamensis]|uniref:SidC homolog n=1 Tax=Legionella birminghamensis TaxID=28083 RepID=A0A378I724_9GAMM|nr:hypothetical protein [Legionella birminghamensis]KTC73915.1 hypothetical protein Lbir_0971 [Legionella birminghamensis]STX30441.1 SidC homolog [Legionella birminghamensis]